MTRHVRKFSFTSKHLGFRAGLMRGLSASDQAFDPSFGVTVRRNDLLAGARSDVQALRKDFQNAERRFFRKYPQDTDFRKAE